MEKEKELKPFKWQGPDGAIHTVSVQKQKDQAAAEAAHNDTIRAMMPGAPPLHSTRKSGSEHNYGKHN
jgi:hypothetical protein